MKSAKRFVVMSLLTLAVVLFLMLVAFSVGVMVKEVLRPSTPVVAQVDD